MGDSGSLLTLSLTWISTYIGREGVLCPAPQRRHVARIDGALCREGIVALDCIGCLRRYPPLRARNSAPIEWSRDEGSKILLDWHQPVVWVPLSREKWWFAEDHGLS